MEIIGRIITQEDKTYHTAKWRNDGVRDILEKSVPDLKDWFLGTINIRIVSPQGLYLRAINTAETKDINIPDTYYEGKGVFKGEPMRLTPVDFEIESKVSSTKGFLYIPLGIPHPNIDKGIAELIAKEELCDKFKVKDGDKITIRVNLC